MSKIFDTPELYDLAFSYSIDKEIEFLSSFIRSPSRLLFPACGTGRYCLPLAKIGHEITAFDKSLSMLEYAKLIRGHPNIKYLLGDMSDLSLQINQTPKVFDLAYSLNNSFRYLTNYLDVTNHLELINKHLKYKGKYILEFGLNDSSCDIGRGNSWRVFLQYPNKALVLKSQYKIVAHDSIFSTESVSMVLKRGEEILSSVYANEKLMSWRIDLFRDVIRSTGFKIDSAYNHKFQKINYSDFDSKPVRIYWILNKTYEC